MDTQELFTDNDLTVLCRETDRELHAIFQGMSHARDPSAFLEPLLSDFCRSVCESGKALVLDFRQLQRMNSSTVPPILRVIAAAQVGSFRLNLLYDRNQHWQSITFSVLRAFETLDRRITVSGGVDRPHPPVEHRTINAILTTR